MFPHFLTHLTRRMRLVGLLMEYASLMFGINVERHLVFHLAHCASECAAPKLWAKLK